MEPRIRERKSGGVGGPRFVMVRFRKCPVSVVKGRGGQWAGMG